MEAGRELDALIAEKVMGLGPPVAGVHHTCGCGYDPHLKPYSTDLTAAMEVFDTLRRSGKWCCLRINSDYDYVWDVVLVQSSLSKGWRPGIDPEPEHEPTVSICEESLPLAICLAALKASEVK